MCALCLLPGACSTWQVHPGRPADLLATEAPSLVRASLGLDSAVVISNPEIRGDSLVGVVNRAEPNPTSVYGGATTRVAEEAVAIPLTEFTDLASRRVSAGKTVGLILAVPAGTIVALGLLWGATTGWEFTY